MLRFPYRAAWPEQGQAPALGFLARMLQRLFGPAESPSRSSDNAPRPILSIRIRGPLAARRLRSALLDTGSRDSLFPAALAEPLGIILGARKHFIHWRGQRHWVEFHDVELELGHSDVVWRWRTRAGFTPAPLAYALLGYRGCLEFLDAKFFGADQVVELETNRHYPGAVSAFS